MANAGTVVVDFAAETAKFTAELKKVRGDLRALQTDVASIQRFFSRVGSVFRGALVVAGLTAITRATAESEQAQAQLDSALKNSGDRSVTTRRQFTQFASEMQRVTTFTDEAVLGVESILLSFQGLSGGTVLRASEAVLDLSTRMRVDLNSAAKLVGKALADPEKGLTALARAGVIFSASQKDVIKGLVESGDTAKAQDLILKGLESRFEGAARAARNNFGGALTAVKNATGDLLEARSGLPGATKALNSLADRLNDPSTKEAFDSLISFLAQAATLAIQATGGVIQLFTALHSKDPLEGVLQQIELRHEQLKNLVDTSPDAIRIQRELLALESQRAALVGRGGQASRARFVPDLSTATPDVDEEFEQKRLDRLLALQTSIADQKRTIALKEFGEHSKFLDDSVKAEEEAGERLLENQTRISEGKRRLALQEFDELSAQLDREVELTKASQQVIADIKAQAANIAIGILQTLGAKNRAFAVAAIVLEKALAIRRIIMANLVGAELAASSQLIPGNPASLAAAAAAKAAYLAAGAKSVALAIGLEAISGGVQIAQTLSSDRGGIGGTNLGTPSNPIDVAPNIGEPRDQRAIVVHINGFVNEQSLRHLRDAFDELTDRDMIIIGP